MIYAVFWLYAPTEAQQTMKILTKSWTNTTENTETD